MAVIRRQLLLVPLLAAGFAGLAMTAGAQGVGVDFNQRYRFPLSFGVEYQSLSPFAAYGAQYNIFDLAAGVRWPLPKLPVLQPLARVGLMRFDSQDAVEPIKWDHTHYYGGLGLAYAYRFAKNFEVGAEALVGFSEAVFPNLFPDGARGSANLFAEAGVRIALDPSFNLSIDVHPNLKYLRSLSPLTTFDGFLFGIGFSAGFRLGADPDVAGGVIRALRFSEGRLPPVFAAMQSYYASNPVGSIVLTNAERSPAEEVRVSFFQAGYMDSPTESAAIPRLAPGESREVPLLAVLNQEVFRTEGTTPLTGEVIVTYTFKGRPAEQRQPLSYDLQDKTALSWDDNRKVAAFITPADSALRNYASFVRQAAKEQVLPGINEPLQAGMQLYRALGLQGVLYQADPVSPFTRAQSAPQTVDSISLPRDTLKRITGDCDDLTVLFDSLLESVGVETGFITTPGHIYSAFNTGQAGADFRKIHPDREMTINVEGSLWVPVEITLLGKEGFLEAWRRGVEEWRQYEGSPERRGLYLTRASQQVYRPVGLKETDLGLQYARPEEIARAFNQELDRVVEVGLAELIEASKKRGSKDDYNRLGVAYAQARRYPQAQAAFDRALALDPGFLAARINLANLLFLKPDYQSALARYQEAWKSLQAKGQERSPLALKLMVNLSSTYYRLERFGEAQQYYRLAQSVNPDSAAAFAYLGDSTARAAEQRGPGEGVLFVEEEVK